MRRIHVLLHAHPPKLALATILAAGLIAPVPMGSSSAQEVVRSAFTPHLDTSRKGVYSFHRQRKGESAYNTLASREPLAYPV